MIVCVCNRISDRDIARHVSQGCGSFDDLQIDTGVAGSCGRCENCAREVFDAAASRRQPDVCHVTPDPALTTV
jgi:bacterioferritin-associated ferredoxin